MRNGSNQLLYSDFYSLYCFSFFFFCQLTAFSITKQKLSDTFFSFVKSNHPENVQILLSPPFTPVTLPFYLLRLPQANAVIFQAFEKLSHPLAASSFKGGSTPPCCMLSLWFPTPAARHMQWCQTWTLEKEESTQRSGWWKEGEHLSERLRGATAKLFLYPPLFSKADYWFS